MAQRKKEVTMEGAPYWYNTHLDKLDLGWSKEEALELERYCEKILKNCAEEDMTPKDRWLAHMAGKPADRKTFMFAHMLVYATRQLDAYADALKPIDCWRNPKLMLKALMATCARYKEDFITWAMISFTEGLWGGHAKMVEYGNPALAGDPPIKNMKDLEAAEVPDPYCDGLFPGYLWTNRELRRYIDKYKIPMVHFGSMCPGPTEVAQMAMMGWNPFLKALMKDRELAKAASEKALIYNKRIGRALIKESQTEGMFCCQFTGGFPLKGNEWVADLWKDLAVDLKDYSKKEFKYNVHLQAGYSFLSGVFEWYDVFSKHGAMAKDTAWDGGTGGHGEVDMQKVFDWHREHDIQLGFSPSDKVTSEGPISLIDQEVKAMCDQGRSHRRFTPNVAVGYFAPPPHVDAAIAAMKKYSKL